MEDKSPQEYQDVSEQRMISQVESDTTLSVSLNKIIIFLVGSLIVGNFVFLWNVHGDLTNIRTQFNGQMKFEERALQQLEETDTKITDGLNKINSRLDAFENRVTTLEVLVGMKKFK